MAEEGKGLRAGQEILIVYLNDDNQTQQAWATLLSISDSLITFSTGKNTITLPVSRLIKIKQREK